MLNLEQNYLQVKAQVPLSARLVAVSKTKPIEAIRTIYNLGHRDFGENKALELRDKFLALPTDIRWHFIGHLQKNKIKYIIPFVYLIHGVDSWGLLEEINKQAQKNNRVVNCLLQFHIAQEETKFGFSEIDELGDPSLLPNINIVGLMGMASFVEDENQVSAEFHKLKLVFEELKATKFKGKEDFTVLSMGMSDDFKLGLEQGSNLVRIGSSIFGHR